ncbi:ABC-2 type transport system permease protein [Pseudobutyrivibrio sp. YE44]|uniref:ABC transporter permease n=1 Tax=Pseudobutyrivibrio sp. YE44 TaxID=1520802 RepID=UPI000890E248|nr:ABC transporter permease [Pseudobutyrivibrio sp. YE44]SDB24766.1 ABC-2 type transport system permease protein [Pseudobutyrivibrio sp. YE44]
MRVFFATIKKEFQVRLHAYPVSFMVGCILTSFYTTFGAWLMYHYFFRGHLASDFDQLSGTSDYMSYAIVGSLMYLFVVRTCLNVSRTLITELREGTLESLMLAPFKRTAYFVGNMTLQTLMTFGETAIATLIGLAFGLRVHDFCLWKFVISVVLSLYGFFGLSLILGCVMLYARDTYISQNTLFTAMFLVCGICFPKEYLPWGLRLLGSIIPVTDAVTLVRTALLGGMSSVDFLALSLRELLLGAIYIAIGFPLMKRVEVIALEKMEG